MKTIGIVAEWNPFHNGHAKLVSQARLDAPDACIISVMSGAFCQRGEIPAFDKWTRADMALAGGVDLVLELPQVYATASLEGFARGGIASLHALCPLDALYCGSESGDASHISQLAFYLKNNEETFHHWIRQCLSNGESYASASQRFLLNATDTSDNLVLGPNDRLALQYRWALPDTTELHVVKRNVAHDAPAPASNQLSGSAIRTGLQSQNENVWQYLPATSTKVIQALSDNGSSLSYQEHLLYALKIYACSHSAEDIATLVNIQDGWTPRLLQAIKKATSFDHLLDLAQTRQYTRSRIQRLCLELLAPSPDMSPSPGYVRILGASARGRAFLSQHAPTAPLVLNVGKDKRTLSASALMLLEHDIKRQNLADQLCRRPQFDRDYLEPPRIWS